MNPEKNRIPQKVSSIHLTASCGTGMGALACLLKDQGYRVTGSDQNVYPPMSTFLADKGVRLYDGFAGENLAYGPDLVVVGNAVSQDNPEARRVMADGLFYCSMPQALNHFAAHGKKTLLVTGTHGKTTTASMLAWNLYTAGKDPSFFIGGILSGFDANYRIGKGPHFVIEGDEYDTAFFDKGPKFLHFHPDIAILTSIEFDHADIFRDLDHVKQAFDKLICGLSPEAVLIACDDDSNIDELVQNRPCRVLRYGKKKTSEWQVSHMETVPPWTLFTIISPDRPLGTFQTRMPGRHNMMNALAVTAAAAQVGISGETAADALATFQGPRRRQEIRGIRNGITVMDDFAHHPTAVRETVAAVKSLYPRGRLIAVFEPRTNTSMRDVFQDVYPRCFAGADIVCVRKPPLLKKIPQGHRFSSGKLVDDLRAMHTDAYYFEDTGDIIGFLKTTAREGDVILVMSNGGFDNIHERLLAAL